MENYIAMDGDINDGMLYNEYIKYQKIHVLERSIIHLEKKRMERKRKQNKLQDELSMIEIEIIGIEENIQEKKKKRNLCTKIEIE